MLSAIDVHKTYGAKEIAFKALRGVTLEIQSGESVAIVGKSGSGKSTLMHLLAGLDHPTAGTIAFKNRPLHKMTPIEKAEFLNRHVGFVFQQFYLQPSLTALENVVLPLKIAGENSAIRTEKARTALAKVGLSSKLSNKATDLSGGEKQRVAIARALAAAPELVFADEPTGNLDSETSQEIITLLFDLHRKENLTLIIVTHDADLAALCNRQIHIKDGRIV